MQKVLKIIIPGIVLVALIAIAVLVYWNPPQAERRDAVAGPLMTVETLQLQRQDYQIMLQSYGTIQPRTQSMLMAQVPGQIIEINPSLRDGGFFSAGEVLLHIDSRDYYADVSIAEAALMDAKQVLAEEQARSEQAKRDWNRLGNSGEAPALVLRKPQLLAAESRLLSAEAGLAKAKLGLERTQISAPYAGRVLRKQVDVGQVVNSGSGLAEVYASDYVEVRLPIRNRDLPYIDLPEAYRDQAQTSHGPDVMIYSERQDEQARLGTIIRTESAIDDNARQLHVVAQIHDPFSQTKDRQFAVKIGQYVTAEISGRKINNALVIPNSAIYQGSYVYIVENQLLQRKAIHIAWQNNKEALIETGIEAGQELVLTSLGQVTSGIKVKIHHQNAAPVEDSKE